MKRIKRVIAIILSITILITCSNNGNLFYATEDEQNVSTNITDEDTLMVEGTNSFGSLLANELENEMTEQEENDGCNIFSVEIQDTVAIVNFEITQYAMLVVGIYDEAGTKMLATGEIEVMKGETEAYVDIDIETMPEYFYVRAFLIDEESMRPLCTACESSMYTQEMQEFLSKTTDDFNEDKVLNLDDDKTNNFAVYSDETVIVPESDVYNQVTLCNEENNTYIMENIDNNISNLQPGSLFSYEYQDGIFLIVKVAAIDINGTTATIVGEDITMEEVFDYVKIDATSYTQDIRVDESTCADGVIYNGDVQIENDDLPKTYKYEITPSASYVKEFEYVDQKIASDTTLTGKLGINITTSAKLYITKELKYIEVKLDYKAYVNLVFSGKTEEVNLPLGYFNVSPLPGVYITFIPSLVVDISAKVTLNGQLHGVIGFRASNNGNKNLTTTPQFEAELKGEIKVFLGISLKPEIKILTEKIANAKLEASIGVEIKGTSKYSIDNNNSKDIQSIHECSLCIDGDIVGVVRFSYSASILDKKDWTYDDKIEFSVKISDFYFSYEYGDFDFTSCPHYKYKILFNVVGIDGKSMQNASIKVDGERITTLTEEGKAGEVEELLTDKDGKTIGYLSSGAYKALVSNSLYGTTKKVFNVADCATSVYVSFNVDKDSNDWDGEDVGLSKKEQQTFALGSQNSGAISNDGCLYMWGYHYDSNPVKILDNVKCLSHAGGHSGAITEDGSLYMWDGNTFGEVGNGNTEEQVVPVKVLDKVVSLSLGSAHSGAITEDGSLYMWGNNADAQIGNGNKKAQLVPIKVLDNVMSISLKGQRSAAITEDGNLYMWGDNNYGAIGNNTFIDQLVPIKVLDNVVSVALGESHSGAITEDGSLYMWGDNISGQIGNGTTKTQLVPIKVLDNVVSLSLGLSHSGAITEDGSLYMWGNNYWGQIGNGTTENQLTPIKVLDNVVSVSLSETVSGAITQNGNLYMWGDNRLGGVGTGDYICPSHPLQILQNVKTIELGWYCSGAVTEDGSLYMWGNNDYGQIGNGTTEDQLTPVKIMDNVKLPSKEQSIKTERLMSTNLYTSVDTYKNTTGEVLFTDLAPNETYNFYVMKDRETTEPFDSENLLYITQAVSDDSGNLTISYEPTKEVEDVDIFVAQMSQTDLSSAEVVLSDLKYSGEIMYVNPKVTLAGRILTEGKDYELLGDYSALEDDEYTVTVHGIGLYTGKIDVSYNVYKDRVKGDINNDGKVNLQDLMKGLHYTSGRISLEESDLLAGDVNGDGKVTIADLMRMLHYISGRIETL